MEPFLLFLFVLLLIFLSVVIIFPIIILVKINSLGNKIRQMSEKISALSASGTQPPAPEKAPKVYREPEIQKAPEIVPEIRRTTERRPRPAENIIEYTPAAVREEPVIHPETKKPEERTVFEKLSGTTNWLSRIGIITLVLGIGFFVKYAIDQNWINEIGRVGIGLLTGGIIIGIAHQLRTKYRVFSSLLAGGGISVFYITITIAFREYALFGQPLAFVLLIITTGFSVLLSLLYDRKDLAVFSLLGGFASPLMVSTGVGNYIVLFSYIFILNTGMLIVSYKKQWRILGIISFLLTFFFFGMWIARQTGSGLNGKADLPYFNLSLFITLFYIQFYLLALFDHFKSGKKISAYQALLILANNLFAFLAYLYIFNDLSFNIRGLITLSLAVINAIVLMILFKNQRIDRNMIYLIIAIVLSFVSLAIPIQLKGHVITLFWAAESVLLLWLWQKSQIKVFYVGFISILALTLISYFMDINHLYSYNDPMPILSNRLFVTGVFVVAAFAVNRWLLNRESDKTQVAKAFEIIIIALAYIVPILELNIQLAHHTDNLDSGLTSFRFATLAVFTAIYTAVLGIIYRKKVSSKKYIFGLLYFAVILYALFYTKFVTDLRYDIFHSPEKTYPAGYFSIHLLSLPAIAWIVYLTAKNLQSFSTKQSARLTWLLTILVVAILSVETDNIVVWMSGNTGNYSGILHDVHTFGYPILWGIIAMILMILGLNRKEALLRQISLVFFGLIIVKFYAYDVWNMSQSGRIISFVLLGVILLLVSFLQQKIRTLVRSDEKNNENNEIRQ